MSLYNAPVSANIVDTSVLQRYQKAMERNPVPNAMPSMYSRQSFLPGQTSFIRKKLEQLKRIATPSSIDSMTDKFEGHRIDPRTGVPKMFGRGKRKRVNRKSGTSKTQRKSVPAKRKKGKGKEKSTASKRKVKRGKN